MSADTIDPQTVKLGKKLGKVEDPRTFQLGEFMPSTLLAEVNIPKSWRIGSKRHEVPMFANDEHGDCTIASNGHRIIVQEAAVGQGHEIKLTDEDILRAYSQATGFDPKTGANDNGAYLLDIANFMRKTGIGVEKDKTAHTIEAYIEVQRKTEYVRAGMVTFGGLWLGLWLPNSAQAQTGKLWDVPAQGPIGDGEPGSWGGHAVYAVGYDDQGVMIYTWGREQKMTWAFFQTYVDEAYVFVTEDYLRKSKQTTPRGFDITRLNGYLKELSH